MILTRGRPLTALQLLYSRSPRDVQSVVPMLELGICTYEYGDYLHVNFDTVCSFINTSTLLCIINVQHDRVRAHENLKYTKILYYSRGGRSSLIQNQSRTKGGALLGQEKAVGWLDEDRTVLLAKLFPDATLQHSVLSAQSEHNKTAMLCHRKPPRPYNNNDSTAAVRGDGGYKQPGGWSRRCSTVNERIFCA